MDCLFVKHRAVQNDETTGYSQKITQKCRPILTGNMLQGIVGSYKIENGISEG
jgi:hypothetical protein